MTLQEQYNSIKIGGGNKDQFIKHARSLFPEYFNQYTDFNTAANVLKSKQIISEAAGGVVAKGFDIYDWKKILAEEVKAEEKETSKEVTDKQSHAFQPSDMKNADNVNFNEIMKGFYAEMRDEKNTGKTGDEIKAMVVKNLAKDPLFYTKDGMFGVKGLGYTNEAPGLGEPKEPKGKHKSSGYGDLDAEIKIKEPKSNVQDSLGNQEAETSMPKKVKEMPDKGVTGVEKKIKLKESKYRVYTDNDHMDSKDVWQNEDGTWPEVSDKWNLTGEYETDELDEVMNQGSVPLVTEEQDQKVTISGIEKAISMLKSELKNNGVKFETNGNKVMAVNSPKVKMAVKMVKERVGMQSIKINENLVEQKLRSLIQQIIKEELTEESKYEDTMPKYRLGALKKLLDASMKDGSPQDVITHLQNAIQSLEKQA